VAFHACHRAIVRGKVEGLAAGEDDVEPAERARAGERARRRLALAGRFAWQSGEPVVVACAGLSGTGKSAVASLIGEATGWRVLSSDVLRRRTAPRAGRDRYDPAARAAVYDVLRHEVEGALTARESIIADATFLSRAERDRLARTARGLGSRHVFVECVADERVVRRRLEARHATSISEARFDVYVAQRRDREAFGDDEPVLRIETSGAIERVRRALIPGLWAWRQGRPIERAPAA
jgi:hypothetical protein